MSHGHESESSSVVSDSLWSHGLLHSPWNAPGQSTGVGSLSLLQGSFQPRDQTQFLCIAGRFFTSWATGEAHHIVIELGKMNYVTFPVLKLEVARKSSWSVFGKPINNTITKILFNLKKKTLLLYLKKSFSSCQIEFFENVLSSLACSKCQMSNLFVPSYT